MSLKDKLEIGLKPDAPFRKDNLPDFQQDDPACDVAATPADTPAVERARKECTMPPEKQEQLEKEREIPGDTPSVERARKDCTMPPVKQRQIAEEEAAARERQTTRPVAKRRTSTGR